MRKNYRRKKKRSGVLIMKGSDVAEEWRRQLHLDGCLTRPITAQDVMKVGGQLDQTSTTSSQHEPLKETYIWLKHLLMLDYETRDRDIPVLTTGKESSSATTDKDDFFSDDDDAEDDVMHPMDNLLLVFLSCDMFLRQMFVRNLFLCRLAVPLVIPNYNLNECEIVLMAMQKVVLECALKNQTNLESPALDAPCHILSMVRMGTLSNISKSNILNHFLDSKGHPTFVHWNCKNGSCKRQISDGMIELSWFLPRSSDSKHDLTAVLNLRGDSLHYPAQLNAIKKTSNIILCMIDYSMIRNAEVVKAIQQIPRETPLIIIINLSDPKENKEHLQTFDSKIDSNNRNCKLMKYSKSKNIIAAVDKLHANVAAMLGTDNVDNQSGVSKLKLRDIETQKRWAIDSTHFDLEKFLSVEIMNELVKNDISEIKSRNFPLQGKLWQEWSSEQKKSRRVTSSCDSDMDENEPVDNTEGPKQKMYEIEKQQLEQLSQCSEATLKCVSILNKCSISRMQFFYFLADSLNTLCREQLPELYAESRKLWLETRANPSRRPALLEVENRLRDSSVGMEHLFREFSQMFQAEHESTANPVFNLLPSAVASLVVEGQPFELLDGDAGNVPIDWIKEVMDCIANYLGDAKIVIVSVLGIQSSGKSTLLNTMFGLQFAVSAGRCTKGAFMQLVKAEAGQPYDYILVLDTEGLRSAELAEDSKDRDNEIATFVIGVGDVTIINIKGENYAEMKDVIQIAVHAFFRMSMVHKNLDMNKRCLFIHQNSPAANAKAKNDQACRQLQEAFDDITKEAAGEENMNGIASFSQIIKFDCLKDIWYFPDLWQGTPPMAYTNPDYSRAALDVRRNIVSNLCKQDGGRFKTIQYFADYVRDLWNAILDENFVFRFQNCLQIKSFHLLEAKCHDILSEFSKGFSKWEQNKFAEMKVKCKSPDDITDYQTELLNLLEEHCEKLSKEAIQALDQFCQSNLNASILYQWQDGKTEELETEMKLKTEIWLSKTTEKLEYQISAFNSINEEQKHRERLYERADEIAQTKRSVLDNDIAIDVEFDSIWEDIQSGDGVSQKDETADVVKEDVVKELRKSFVAHRQNVEGDLKNAYFNEHSFVDRNMDMIDISDIKDEHVSISSSKGMQVYNSSDPDWLGGCQIIHTFINNTIRVSMYDYIDENQDEQQYSASIIFEFIRKLQVCFMKKISNDEDKLLSLLPSLHTKLAVTACQIAFPTFCNIYFKHLEMSTGNDEMKAFKSRLKQFFIDRIKQTKQTEMVSAIVAKNLEEILGRQLLQDVEIKIQERIQVKFKTKTDLLCSMLQELAHKEDLELYMEYLSDPKGRAIPFIQEYCKTIVTDGNCGIATATVDDMHKNMKKWFDAASADFGSDTEMSAAEWADSFWRYSLESISPELVNPDKLLPTIVIRNDEAFKQTFMQQVQDTIETLRPLVKEGAGQVADPDNVMMFYTIVQQIWGCEEKCPFCHEPCCISKGHLHQGAGINHECLHHRPEGTVKSMCEKKRTLKVYNCNYKVAQKRLQYKLPSGKHKYKSYKKYYPHWLIEESESMCNSDYWQWFSVTFGKELAIQQGCKPPKLPASSTRVTKQQAIKSLSI